MGMISMKKKLTKEEKAGMQNGFTLAELLIVVAIIGILVSISIPIFTGLLEKSREATDMANVRGAYAEVMVAANSGEDDLVRTVSLKQKKDDWQTSGRIMIGGITKADTDHWIGIPRADGKCKVYYDPKKGPVLDWNGGMNLWTSIGMREGYWSGTWVGPNSIKTPDGKEQSVSTCDRESKNGLYKIKGGQKYSITCTYNPHIVEKSGKKYGVLASGLLLFDGNGYCKMDTASTDFNTTETTKTNTKEGSAGGTITYKYKENSDGTITFTATFESPDKESNYYMGMNFISRDFSNTSTSGHLFKDQLDMTDQDVQNLQNQIQNSFVLEEVQ